MRNIDILKTIDFPKVNVIRIEDFSKELEPQYFMQK